ncbi:MULTISPECIES: hypothetical protein [unclassified Agrobacterium]|uniref:hypothetical protein n=1 Tax=unclassified Agrobacterium TaxID=2632611 RepID=UPI002448600D|nr:MULTISPECIES: hypothetical protein [unclassified Agrobacterium]MDH0699711.1 hypothetical protein [Agrobacterium sp. GD03871]MDH1062578.1 hypothetical protein [Agrobacterium sp. GD03992]MDH2228069.1 hypothetical protein [Agrobacterium sp. GD03642]
MQNTSIAPFHYIASDIPDTLLRPSLIHAPARRYFTVIACFFSIFHALHRADKRLNPPYEEKRFDKNAIPFSVGKTN